MKVTKPAWIVGALMCCGHLEAAVVAFDFAFFNTSGMQVGSGMVSFEDYSGMGSSIKSFSAISRFSWQFDIQAAGIVIGSSQGDTVTQGAIESQGLVIRQHGNSARSLDFFDRTGAGIFASDDLGGIMFHSFSNNVDFIFGGEVVGGGYFTAFESSNPGSVPEPTTSGMALLAAFGLLHRRRG